MPRPGDQVGPYRVTATSIHGGAGERFLARDAADRPVVLELLPAGSAAPGPARDRFLREAAVVTRLREPHLVPVHRYGEDGGRLFLATEALEGDDLATRLVSHGALDPARAVDVVGQVARALDAAHDAGVVHGGLTPERVVLLTGARPGDDVRLTGLGSSGGPAPADPGGDVQALAALLFELLTGRGVPDATDTGGRPPAPSAFRAGLPEVLDAVVLRGLSADPTERWTSAGGMAAAARAALSVSGVHVPALVVPGAAPHTPPGRHGGARTVAVALAGAAFVAVLAAVLRSRLRQLG